MDKTINKATQRSLQNLKKVLDAFAPYTDAWFESDDSVLNAKEIAIIKSYQENKTHMAYVDLHQKVDGSPVQGQRTISVVYNKAVRKLQIPRSTSIFKKWLMGKLLLERGLIKNTENVHSAIEPVAHMNIHIDALIRLLKALNTPEGTFAMTAHEFVSIELIEIEDMYHSKSLRDTTLAFELNITTSLNNVSGRHYDPLPEV